MGRNEGTAAVGQAGRLQVSTFDEYGCKLQVAMVARSRMASTYDVPI